MKQLNDHLECDRLLLPLSCPATTTTTINTTAIAVTNDHSQHDDGCGGQYCRTAASKRRRKRTLHVSLACNYSGDPSVHHDPPWTSQPTECSLSSFLNHSISKQSSMTKSSQSMMSGSNNVDHQDVAKSLITKATIENNIMISLSPKNQIVTDLGRVQNSSNICSCNCDNDIMETSSKIKHSLNDFDNSKSSCYTRRKPLLLISSQSKWSITWHRCCSLRNQYCLRYFLIVLLILFAPWLTMLTRWLENLPSSTHLNPPPHLSMSMFAMAANVKTDNQHNNHLITQPIQKPSSIFLDHHDQLPLRKHTKNQLDVNIKNDDLSSSIDANEDSSDNVDNDDDSELLESSLSQDDEVIAGSKPNNKLNVASSSSTVTNLHHLPVSHVNTDEDKSNENNNKNNENNLIFDLLNPLLSMSPAVVVDSDNSSKSSDVNSLGNSVNDDAMSNDHDEHDIQNNLHTMRQTPQHLPTTSTKNSWLISPTSVPPNLFNNKNDNEDDDDFIHRANLANQDLNGDQDNSIHDANSQLHSTTTIQTTNTQTISTLTSIIDQPYQNVGENGDEMASNNKLVPELSFEFTKPVYNVTIPENSLSKIYATSKEKMGIYISDPALTVRYKIVAGDQDKIFRADHKHVGNFYFLMIRVRHDKNAVLNRENRSKYELRVRATITSEQNKHVRFKCKCNVTVTVLDCNDISPIFFEKFYQIDVLEDVPLETRLTQVTAIDPDIGLNGEIYYSIAHETQYFAIHPTLGIIYNTRPLFLNKLLPANENHLDGGQSSSTEMFVNLTVQARDRGHHHSSQTIESSKTKVSIRILAVNRHSPRITVKQHSSLPVMASTTATKFESSIYAVIHVIDDDLGIYGQICSLDIIQGNDHSIFAITNQSSNDYNLQMAKSIPELLKLSPQRPLIPFELILQAKDCGGRTSNQTVHISMDDRFILNLHFTKDKYYRELHENSLIGTQVLQVDLKVSYNDNHFHKSDSTISSTMNLINHDLLHFSIISGNHNETFGITRNGIIYTRKRLDREKMANYLLVVRGQHQLNQIATTMVYIDLSDANDNYPLFKNVPSNGIVQLTVNENKPNGSIIYRAEAQDLDSDNNNRYVTYDLVYYGHDRHDLPFDIDVYTGDVSIVGPLDYESMHRNYLLFIRASDWGEPFRLQTQMLLNVTIADINDHRPQFDRINCTIRLPLNTKPFTNVMKLFATDLDHNSNIVYKMFPTTSQAERCFRLDEKSGQLELICNLKKELSINKSSLPSKLPTNQVLWTLSTSATDGLYFSDANMIDIVLVDEDSQHNKETRSKRLSLRNDNQEQNNINVECIDSGMLHKYKHATSFVRQQNATPYNMLTFEEKQAIEQLMQHTINIQHDHNHRPVFLHNNESFMEISLAEDVPVGTKVATIQANDSLDLGLESALIWSLNLQLSESEDGVFYQDKQIFFEIGQFDGQLYLIAPLDYETVKQIYLLVTVCDQCIYNQKCSNQTVSISVTDVNDNVPVLDDSYTFEVSEAMQPGAIIGTIHGTDKDSGQNALLEYYLDGHIDTFSIDLINGTLRLESKLDRESIDKYIVYVTAVDSGQPSLSSTALITIHVTDINDNAPLFFQSYYFLKVREDMPVGTRLMRVSAFDQDEDDAADIRYQIKQDDNIDNTFDIDEMTGNIRLKKALDYERMQIYNLSIVASDQGRPILSTSTYLLLEVVDVNENYYPPKFDDLYANVSVKENMPIGTLVTKVSAVDPDNPNIPVIYQIIGGDGLGRFSIDSLGNIFTNAVLDCEINSHYWLTIVAKDRAAVPLTSYLEMYIQVEDVNDMPPITKQSFYTVNVLENITVGSSILNIEAFDQDVRLSNHKSEISFKIENQNVPFEINSKGVLKTNGQLDRETISRYVIDLAVMEPLSNVSNESKMSYLISRTPIIINVLDVNEYEPKSIMNKYRCYTYSNVFVNLPVCQIIAYDQDYKNDEQEHDCPIRFNIIEGNEKKYFHLDSSSGIIYPTVDHIAKGSYDFMVSITDCNTPQQQSPDDDQETTTVHVIIRVLPVSHHKDNHPPLFEPFDSIVMINRDEPVGHTAAWIKTSDADHDRLCFYILDGNVDNSFAFLDNGALVLAKSLMNLSPYINQFNLTLMATDGKSNSSIQLLVNIVNDFDETMSFGQQQQQLDAYVVNVLENITVGSNVLQLFANSHNHHHPTMSTVFSIYSTQSPETLTKFEVESWSGKIVVKSPLDYEQGKQHVLLIEARSGGRKHANSMNLRAFAKVIINVIDVNDQPPQFISSYFETNVVESSAIGTSILQVQAFDGDYGQNANINYSIASGNIDQTFDIEPTLGYLFVAKALDFRQLPEYYLLVKATDQGQPSLSSTANVRILISLPDQSPPKFELSNYVVDVREDEKVGTVILSVKMVNKQTSFFTIINGNIDDTFAINVNNGELYLRRPLDYEHVNNYQLTIEASNLIAMNATTQVFITVVDINDNAPFWNQTLFTGQVFETTPVNTFVQSELGTALVVKAYDRDSFHNLVYSINEHVAKQYFSIEPRTGAISLIQMLNCEKHQVIEFSVSVVDNSGPKLKASNNAMVRVKCLAVNDCPPVFVTNKFYGTLMLPTYENVIITKIMATDCDYQSDESNQHLQYSLEPLNHIKHESIFKINSTTGQITTNLSNVNWQIKPGIYEMIATASDGKFTGQAKVIINAKPMPASSLRFRQTRFYGSIVENSSSHMRTVLMPAVDGSRLNEHLIFRLMTPTDLFKIARTSGAILYRGIPVDRETLPKIELAIEVQSISSNDRIAQALVEINVEDVNDNAPIFVGLPYNFVLSTDANVGDLIGKIQAVDIDSGMNGKVHYSILSGDQNNLFALNSVTGHLTLAKEISSTMLDSGDNYTLLIMAKDLGKPSLESLMNVTLRMVTGSIPLFDEPFYNITISENHPPMLPFITIKAESSHGRQIFYQIEAGNDNDEFLLDFNTDLTTTSNTLCTVSIVEKLDRETTSQYNLLISATDAISEASSTVNLFIKVDDVNDNQPMFTKFLYNVSVPENLMIGEPVLKVEAYDADSGQNARLQYHMIANNSHFFISPDEGVIYLKSQLDYETDRFHHFEIMVTDFGTPQLTSTAQVRIDVLDVNDNAPILPASFTTCIDEDIEKGGFVTKITAFDVDFSDRNALRYKILSGSNMTFIMDEMSGVIHVRNLKNHPYLYYRHRWQHTPIKRNYALNISVSDGIYSSTETYFIVIKPANHHSPRFNRALNNVAIPENQPAGSHVLTVNATDPDDGQYGQIEYFIMNDYAKKFFSINPNTGQITLKNQLDYEQSEQRFYWLILAAQDKGKRLGVSRARIALIDQNDNIPRFIVNEYQCSICSNAQIGSTILSVLAVDDDDDADNTIIEYSIYDDQPDESNNSNNTMKYINDYFEMASDTGYIHIRKNLTDLVGKKIQFFVKASNVINGRNENVAKNKFNVVPVTIEIVESCPLQRREAFLYEVFVKENFEPGSVVATLNLGHYKDAELNIVGLDNMMDSNKFRIDHDGKIHVNEALDREIKSKHILALKVSDRSYLTSYYFYVIINIMDENDCTPYFDSASYYLNIAENQPIGSSIFKVNGFDNDIDLHNNALKYRIQYETVDYQLQNTFRIDENSGWIILTGALDRETVDNYDVPIAITDGTHTNSTWLHIAVFDVNDNKPTVQQARSIAAIYENSFLGTVILRVKVDDPDLNPELRYFISDGDEMNHFAVTSSGDVYVNRTLDRETMDHYSLKILVTDGKYYTDAHVEIDVLDVNDNGPVCVKSKYVEMVSEAVPVGTYILTVEANDQDDADNARLYFELDGQHGNDFVVDANTGRLKTNAKLDREKQSHYLLKVIVYDYQNRDWHCESFVEILLSDVNDEAPKFMMQSNQVQVPEDCQIGTILGKVNAIDLDISPNRQITYQLMNSSGEFVIHDSTGIIRLARTLDRETQSFYNLTIMAYDSNLPNLNSTTSFMINVTDINDNAPEFQLQTYRASIDENVAIGTQVIKLFATSKDTGINAEIQYRIVNGNFNQTFTIDKKTGIITTANEIDYETSTEYFLIVEAQDQGEPPLSSEVNVLISVNDINDMRPQFSQRSYDIVIREDASIGDKIYQIVASDGDSPPNANLTYSFENNLLSYKEFNIEPSLGILTVGKQLDREMISSYILEVYCSDNGHPHPLTASVLINVEISDYNDNAPMLDKINQTVYLKENRPIGYKLLDFSIYDADSSLNSGPFKLELVEGNDDGQFIIYDSDASLRTNASFNQSMPKSYDLKIKVTDSGNPPLHSFAWLKVIVIQESQVPPKVHPLVIAINSLEHFPGGLIGQINATDDDQYDQLHYSLTNVDDQNVFQVDPNDGFIRALPGLDVGKYKINVTVTDGRFVSYGVVKIEVFIITEQMIENSMAIKIFSVDVKDFINNHFKNFVRSIKSLYKVRSKDVIVISLQQLTTGQSVSNQPKRRRRDESTPVDISLLFAISDLEVDYLSRPVIRAKLLENKYLIENQIGLSFDEITHRSPCQQIQCQNGECREELLLSEDQITYVATNSVTFVSPHHEFKFGCTCRPGFGGKLCNVTVNECYRNPCPTHKECLPVSSSLGYICQCPFGKSGPNCNQIAQNCQSNDGSIMMCYEEFNPISFNGNSYIRYAPMKKIDKLSFRFRTQQLRARILTQENEQLFSILEIVGGYIQYRFDCGQGEGLIRLNGLFVSDGKWHEVVVERKGIMASITLDRRYSSFGGAPGGAHSCNRLKSDIYFGAKIKSNSDNVGDEEIVNGFSGCFDHILFNGQPIPFHKTSKSAMVDLKTLANVQFSCSFKPETGACRSKPCLNGGICNNHDNDQHSFECTCQGPRFKGKLCEIDTMPCSSSPCLNDGVCIADVDACQQGIANCYKCQCRPGFTGTNCQVSHHCTSKSCQNGGVCEETAIGPKCHCHSGWHGLYCEQDIDECQLSTPACHSSASCVNLPGTFRCVCALNSTSTCNSQSLLTTGNIFGSNLQITYQELGILFIILICLTLFTILSILCCTYCSRQSNKKKNKAKHSERDNTSEAGQCLLNKKNNNGATGTFENNFNNDLSGQDKTISMAANNFEMTNMANHVHNNNNDHSSQSNNTNNNNNHSVEVNSSAVNSDEFESTQESNANTGDFITQQHSHHHQHHNQQQQVFINKKNAPIASVSPQMIETFKSQSRCSSSSSHHSKKHKKRSSKSTEKEVSVETHTKHRLSTNSPDSNALDSEQSPVRSACLNQTEGYHWDTSDLCLAETHDDNQPNHHNHHRGFTMVKYEYDHNQSSRQPMINTSTFTKSTNRKSNKDQRAINDVDEVSPLIIKHDDHDDGKTSKQQAQLPSPPLEVKLGSKLEFSKNYFERYLPKHDEQDDLACNTILSNGQINIEPTPNIKHEHSNGNGEANATHNITGKRLLEKQQMKCSQSNAPSTTTLLTFNNSCSLNDSNSTGIDHYSMLTPSSSSCSTTPIAAMLVASSNGSSGPSETNVDHQSCSSSSMSSSSNTDEPKLVSPMSSFMVNGSNHFMSTFNHQNNDLDSIKNNNIHHNANNTNANNKMSSFAIYSSVTSKHRNNTPTTTAGSTTTTSLLSNESTNGIINNNNNAPTSVPILMSSFSKQQPISMSNNNNNNDNQSQMINNNDNGNETQTNHHHITTSSSSATTPTTRQYTFV